MYIPASDPVLFLKLSADYNYAYMAHGRTGGVVSRLAGARTSAGGDEGPHLSRRGEGQRVRAT